MSHPSATGRPSGAGTLPGGPQNSSPPAPEPGSVPAPKAPTGRVSRWLRRHRVLLLLLLVLCILTVLSVWSRSGQDEAALSPANPAPGGAMAVAEILGAQGVDVQQPPDFDAALAALEKHPGATLLFLDPNGFLDSEQRARLADAAGRVVLVEPSFEQLADFAPEIRQAGILPEDPATQVITAGCTSDDGQAAGTVETGGKVYRGPVTCFSPEGTALEGADAAGSYAATLDGSTVVLGGRDLLANETLADEGNAALALRTLGSDGTLVWYRAVPADIPMTQQPADPFSYLPPWVPRVMLWLVLVAALAAFWRGRRLGPLAEEPLPVVVHAAETAEGRARLYQDSNSVTHAAAALRAGAMTRLAARLRLGPGAGADDVTRATAAAAGRSYTDTDQLLNHQLPGSGAELVRWARDLQDLEEEATPS